MYLLFKRWWSYFKRRWSASRIIYRLKEFGFVHKPSKVAETSITVIIPTRDRLNLLRKSVDSVLLAGKGLDVTLLVINNDSKAPETLTYLRQLKAHGHSVMDFPGPFHYSKMMNTAAEFAKTEVLIFLNNDCSAESPSWISSLVNHLDDPAVGIAGSILKFPNGLLQHCGIELGLSGAAGHPYEGHSTSELNWIGSSCMQVSAATFAAVAIRAKDYQRLGGLDERFRVGLNDVDFCIRASKAGLKTVVCTKSILNHETSASRGSILKPKNAFQAIKEIDLFLKLHGESCRNDPYFS